LSRDKTLFPKARRHLPNYEVPDTSTVHNLLVGMAIFRGQREAKRKDTSED
jgi:hypothetical protein